MFYVGFYCTFLGGCWVLKFIGFNGCLMVVLRLGFSFLRVLFMVVVVCMGLVCCTLILLDVGLLGFCFM